MYSYDRTAAKNATTEAIEWLYKKRRTVIQKAFKGMNAEFEKLEAEALEKYPDLDRAEMHRQLQLKERAFRETLL
jgi:hypothetical protein